MEKFSDLGSKYFRSLFFNLIFLSVAFTCGPIACAWGNNNTHTEEARDFKSQFLKSAYFPQFNFATKFSDNYLLKPKFKNICKLEKQNKCTSYILLRKEVKNDLRQ